MTFRVTNDFTGSTTLSAADLDTNFTDVENILNGGLTTANLSGSAGITNSQLANSQFETIVNLSVQLDGGSTTQPSTSVPLAIVGIPGTSSTGNWTVKSATLVCTDNGTAGNTTYKVEFGEIVAAAWSNVTTIISSNNVASAAMVSATPTLAATGLTMHASNPRFLALFVTAWATNAMNTANAVFCVSLKLQRTNGLTT